MPRPMFHAFATGLALVPSGCSATRVAFSGTDDVEAMVIGELDAATETAHVAIYTITAANISSALVNAAGRGVEVQVVADRSQSDWPDQAGLLVNLEEGGVDVRVADGWNGGIMHHKFVVVDGRTVATGSFNFTLSANNANDENLLVLSDPELALAYEDAFQELWSRAQD